MEKISYALGVNFAQQLMETGVTDINGDEILNGINDVLSGGSPKYSVEESREILMKFFEDVHQKLKKSNADESKKFLDDNAKCDGVVVTKSGLQYKIIKPGTGKTPNKNSQVQCHYEGHLINGDVFDSSYERGEPATFGLGQVIAGWTEGLQLIKEGGEIELYIPYELGYGENGMPGAIPPCTALVFKVELLKVM